MVGFVKPSKQGYFDHKQGAFGVMVWTEAGIPEGPDPLVSLLGTEKFVKVSDVFQLGWRTANGLA